MKKIIIGTLLVVGTAIGAAPAQARDCWYCSSGNGQPGWCFRADAGSMGPGGTACTDGGGAFCLYSGTCPLTIVGPVSFAAAGSPVGDCSSEGPLARAESRDVPLEEIAL